MLENPYSQFLCFAKFSRCPILAILEMETVFFLKSWKNKGSTKAGAFVRWSAIWVGFIRWGVGSTR
jgi:hypothetical protein